MSKPHIAATTPFAIDVEKGKDYYWCACGLSKSQPFCDGSHKGGEFVPTNYSADESKTVYFAAASKARTARFATARIKLCKSGPCP